ncbi:hypothetical protein [Brachybacterium alimentarium]|uniref:hypothetical protein n=1 Tax=Brachybacterium alimentarium TaxID=47845 RepID=UPI003FD57725
MSITVQINDTERVIVDAEPKGVTIENSALIVRRDGQIIARFRRHTAWWETTPTQE